MADANFLSSTTSSPKSANIEGYKVLRQTYMLLAMTVTWSALLAGVSLMLAPPPMFGLLALLLVFLPSGASIKWPIPARLSGGSSRSLVC